MSLESSFLKNALDNLNFATFILATLGALAALWFNNKYVSQEVYNKDKEIIVLKLDNLETETQALRFMISQNQTEISKLLPLIEKLETLISNVITQDGNIIMQENMIALEKRIAEIQTDIEYIKMSIMK